MVRSPPQSRIKSAPPRSPCVVGQTLDIVGDKWTLLIIRDLLRGKHRYKDFLESPEGITASVLAQRLKRLQAHGIVERRPYSDNPPRMEYFLTEKGKALGPILRAIVKWGMTHLDGVRTM